MSQSEIGRWIRSTRKRLGMSQTDLARRSGWSAAYICNLERHGIHAETGVVLRPSVACVDALADALGEERGTFRLIAGYAPENAQEQAMSSGDGDYPGSMKDTGEEDNWSAANELALVRKDLRRLEHLVVSLTEKFDREFRKAA